MTTKNEMTLLNEIAKKDNPNISDKESKELKKNNFYYIDDNMQGWYVPKAIPYLSDIEYIIYSNIKNKKE